MIEKKIAVYSRLSLDESEVHAVLAHATVFPPVRRGNCYEHFDQGFRRFCIIDGEFDQSLAVSPGEVLDILRCGAKVYGSSSMGAMRAAELAAYGMVGVGEIYQLTQKYNGIPDSWFGHRYFSKTYELCTYPFIDFLFALDLDHSDHARVVEVDAFCAQYEPRYDGLTNEVCGKMAVALERSLGICLKSESACPWLPGGHGQKKRDAVLLLELVCEEERRVRARNAHLDTSLLRLPTPETTCSDR